MIRLEGIAVGFDQRMVLEDLSLRFEPGALVGLIGPPSSGKSLLLKIIAGLVRPTRGQVWIHDTDLATAKPKSLAHVQKGIGMLFQNNALFDSKTLFENVAFPLRRAESPPSEAEIDRAVRERIADVGLAKSIELFPHALSGGMQKRAGIARATIGSPEVRLFDEPTAGLDPVTSARILRLIVSLHARDARGGVTLIVSNEMDKLLEVVPRTVMLHQGRVAYDGPTAAVRAPSAPAAVRAFVEGDVSFAI
ncbi:MAG: ATP-binding cassette domain-containing protein [Myxococcota bacterium]